MKNPTQTTIHFSARIKVSAFVLLLTAFSLPFANAPTPKAHAQAEALPSIFGCEAVQKISDLKALAEAAAAPKGGFPVIDVGNIAVQAKTNANIDVGNTVRCVLDGLAWTAAKVAIQSMTQSTVNWINSGFEGSPAYVTDLNRNLSRLADTVADDFLRGLDQVAVNSTGISIRAPFQDQIAAQLREEFYRTTSSYGFDVRNPYTGGNAAFTRGDFSQGGLNALFSMSKPENNPYGRYMLARNELVQQIDQAAQTRTQELLWGNGFMSWRGPCGPNARKTPGEIVDLKDIDATKNCPIRTPGALIEETIGITANSPLRQLELADSMNEIVGALMGQLVNQVLGGGGLAGVTRPASGGGQSYLDRASNPNQYGTQTSIANGAEQEIALMRSSIEQYRTAWQRIGTAASAAEQACRTNSELVTQATDVRQQADNNTRVANSIITEITALQAKFGASRNNPNDTAGTSALVIEYQLTRDAAKIIVDALPKAQADADSNNTSGLYAQMQRLAASCR